MDSEFIVREPADFMKVIEAILFYYKNNQSEKALVLALTGDLGAGKTTFTQELGKYLGVAEHVTSPTFTIMKQYDLGHDLFDQLFHLDAYRIEDESEIGPLKIKELILHPRALVCIEWPANVSNIIPDDAVAIDISIVEDNKRRVQVQFKNN